MGCPVCKGFNLFREWLYSPRNKAKYLYNRIKGIAQYSNIQKADDALIIVWRDFADWTITRHPIFDRQQWSYRREDKVLDYAKMTEPLRISSIRIRKMGAPTTGCSLREFQCSTIVVYSSSSFYTIDYDKCTEALISEDKNIVVVFVRGPSMNLVGLDVYTRISQELKKKSLKCQ